jgi:arsenate reductase
MAPANRQTDEMSTTTLYGIPNCDTVRKARAWLHEHAHDNPHLAQFHDFKKLGVPADRLDAWTAALGWERMLNRNGTTWRKLGEGARAAVVDARSAKALMRSQPSVIKRPVVEWGDGTITVGFSEADWAGR